VNRLEKYAREKWEANQEIVKSCPDMTIKELVSMVKMQDMLYKIIYRRLDRHLFG
jgi:hypothetical protein